ncbi:MAG: hypothetical protein LBJ20_02835 [Candidatus Methanoplasma sp.]|jgi:hypothetical protein|nr:hypothetical protein [Candidatus Methanoplasma sp.]
MAANKKEENGDSKKDKHTWFVHEVRGSGTNEYAVFAQSDKKDTGELYPIKAHIKASYFYNGEDVVHFISVQGSNALRSIGEKLIEAADLNVVHFPESSFSGGVNIPKDFKVVDSESLR